MKIISLVAENIKRVVAVEITPNGNMVEIVGRNGQGKTSVLDSIWWALAGATHIQSVPIRKGADKAVIKLDLGELVVTRRFNRTKDDANKITTSLVVENKDGMRPTAPQVMLTGLLDALSLDPIGLMRMDDAARFGALRRLVPTVDFAAIKAAQTRDYDERTAVNRRAKEAQAQADGVVVPTDAPTAHMNEAALVDEIANVGVHNGEIESRKLRREQTAEDVAGKRREAIEKRVTISRMRATIGILEGEAAELETAADELAAKLDGAEQLPEPKDAAEVRARLEEAKRHNALVDKAAQAASQKAALVTRAKALQAQSEEITARMDKREADKLKAISEAELPVPGLSFGDGEVLLDGLPFDQASAAQQIRAALAIAMANNPKLRVIRLTQGSLLDDDGMRVLAEEADKHDFQVWVERVDSSGARGFVIEDGHVKAAAKQPETLL